MQDHTDAQHSCALCFEDVRENLGFLEALWFRRSLCEKCHEAMQPHCRKVKLKGNRVYTLHHYNDFVRNAIIRYKDFGDQYLARVFLESFQLRLMFLFADYVIVCVPSTNTARAMRGFDHCELIASFTDLPVLQGVLVNNALQKQKEKHKLERFTIKESLTLIDSDVIKGKKILLLDDVMTTGSSLLGCFDLMAPYAKKIVGLVLASVDAKR